MAPAVPITAHPIPPREKLITGKGGSEVRVNIRSVGSSTVIDYCFEKEIRGVRLRLLSKKKITMTSFLNAWTLTVGFRGIRSGSVE